MSTQPTLTRRQFPHNTSQTAATLADAKALQAKEVIAQGVLGPITLVRTE